MGKIADTAKSLYESTYEVPGGPPLSLKDYINYRLDSIIEENDEIIDWSIHEKARIEAAIKSGETEEEAFGALDEESIPSKAKNVLNIDKMLNKQYDFDSIEEIKVANETIKEDLVAFKTEIPALIAEVKARALQDESQGSNPMPKLDEIAAYITSNIAASTISKEDAPPTKAELLDDQFGCLVVAAAKAIDANYNPKYKSLEEQFKERNPPKTVTEIKERVNALLSEPDTIEPIKTALATGKKKCPDIEDTLSELRDDPTNQQIHRKITAIAETVASLEICNNEPYSRWLFVLGRLSDSLKSGIKQEHKRGFGK